MTDMTDRNGGVYVCHGALQHGGVMLHHLSLINSYKGLRYKEVLCSDYNSPPPAGAP